jgi:hypothetical protein
MTKFSDLAPASSISAKALDENFKAVAPAENQDIRQVRLQRGQDGWRMEVFPQFPSETCMLSSSGDMPFWLTVSELLNELVNAGLMAEVVDQLNNGGTVSAGSVGGGTITAPGTVAPAAISPGANGSLFITDADEAKWSAAPPSGAPAWREVERCDGKTMYVWATEWED